MSARNNRLGHLMVCCGRRKQPFFGRYAVKVGKRPVKGRAAVKREKEVVHEQAA